MSTGRLSAPRSPSTPDKRFRRLARLTLRELILLAGIAAISMVLKPYVHSAFRPLVAGLNVPVGMVAGGIYMMWLVMAGHLVNKAGAVALVAFLQGILAVMLGMTGRVGPLIIVSYLMPGLALDLLYSCLAVFWRLCRCRPTAAITGAALANAMGTACNSVLLLGLPWPAVLAALLPASVSGGIGGLLGHALSRRLARVIATSPAGLAGNRV